MSNVFKSVEEFNVKVVGVDRIAPKPLDDEEFGFFTGCLKEEIEELEEAHGQDFIAEVDAIIDLVYFAVGGLCRMGIPANVQERLFDIVHNANMQKNSGSKDRQVTHSLDAVKPEGWEPPEEKIAECLDLYKERVHALARDVGKTLSSAEIKPQTYTGVKSMTNDGVSEILTDTIEKSILR